MFLIEFSPYRIHITLERQRGLHCLLGGAPALLVGTLNVLEQHPTAALVLVLEKELGVLAFVGRGFLEVSVHAGQRNIVTIEVV